MLMASVSLPTASLTSKSWCTWFDSKDRTSHGHVASSRLMKQTSSLSLLRWCIDVDTAHAQHVDEVAGLECKEPGCKMRKAAVHHDNAVARDMHVELDEVAVIRCGLHEAHHRVLSHVPPLALAGARASVPVER